MNQPAVNRRTVKSYVLRKGRITAAQQRGLDALWAKFVVTPESGNSIDWESVFCRKAPLAIEIGSGYGEAAASLAMSHPDINHIAVEVHTPGIGALLNKLHANAISNVRVLPFDAVDTLENAFDKHQLYCARIFFPDPWPKKRHHKRRLLNPAFVDTLAQKIEPGGFVHVATDWQNYAQHIRSVFADSPHFDECERESEPRAIRPLTRFASRVDEQVIADLLYRRK